MGALQLPEITGQFIALNLLLFILSGPFPLIKYIVVAANKNTT